MHDPTMNSMTMNSMTTHHPTTHRPIKTNPLGPVAGYSTRQGFSLIELMIVIVIIAVLASIAIPGFQNQVARSHVMGGMSEVRALTAAYEDLALRGITDFELADLGAAADDDATQRCALSMEQPDPDTGDGALICTLIGSPQIQSRTLRFERDGAQGRWLCVSDLPTSFIPQSCQASDA